VELVTKDEDDSSKFTISYLIGYDGQCGRVIASSLSFLPVSQTVRVLSLPCAKFCDSNAHLAKTQSGILTVERHSDFQIRDRSKESPENAASRWVRSSSRDHCALL